jgi:hypothetical protein
VPPVQMYWIGYLWNDKCHACWQFRSSNIDRG